MPKSNSRVPQGGLMKKKKKERKKERGEKKNTFMANSSKHGHGRKEVDGGATSV